MNGVRPPQIAGFWLLNVKVSYRVLRCGGFAACPIRITPLRSAPVGDLGTRSGPHKPSFGS
jgi:hypothetical protein